MGDARDMSRTFENIAAGQVSRLLAEKGVPEDKPVTVFVGEDLTEIARRTRASARARGMTVEIFQKLTKDL